MRIPVPRLSDTAAQTIRHSITHPGLLLDRWVEYGNDWDLSSWQQKPHLEAVIRVAQCSSHVLGPSDAWDRLCLALPGCLTWKQTTLWRLALHLSRAIAVENACLCLHPIYGFPYLPGSGLKGLARAQACFDRSAKTGKSVDEVDEKDEEILRIFGSAKKKDASAGTVIFLEAWPESKAKLELDIVNPHHPDYYRSKGKSTPGDWESPIPVYFLSVAPNTTFRFAVAPRTPDNCSDAEKAKEWLIKGLRELGAGAKTAAGYGYFADTCEYKPSCKETQQQAELLTDQEKADLLARAENVRLDGNDPKSLRALLRQFEEVCREKTDAAMVYLKQRMLESSRREDWNYIENWVKKKLRR